MKKRITSVLLVFCFMISILYSSQGAGAAAKVRLNKTSVTMQTGEKVRLSLRNAPKNAAVTWSSAAKNIAAVSKKGVVTAKKRGTATIRAKMAYKSGGKNRTQRFSCKVTVRNKSTTSAGTGKSLVVYFSAPVAERQGQTDGIASASRTAKTGNYKGNTQYIAELISRETGADLFEIVPENAYPDTYDRMVRQAEQEQNDNARPAIRNQVGNISQYDTIYVGYPIWFSDMPQIMYTFFDTYELGGKEIIPFCTHGGSGLSGTVGRIRNLEPDADVYSGMAVYRTDVTGSDSKVKTWIQAKEK
ncbi:MAG: flavodoxin [Eubacterium sp.]|nr:flavodoxin [Eubacterium sp.]